MVAAGLCLKLAGAFPECAHLHFLCKLTLNWWTGIRFCFYHMVGCGIQSENHLCLIYLDMLLMEVLLYITASLFFFLPTPFCTFFLNQFGLSLTVDIRGMHCEKGDKMSLDSKTTVQGFLIHGLFESVSLGLKFWPFKAKLELIILPLLGQ